MINDMFDDDDYEHNQDTQADDGSSTEYRDHNSASSTRVASIREAKETLLQIQHTFTGQYNDVTIALSIHNVYI